MAFTDPTYIGQIASVTGGVIRVRLRQDMPTTLVLVDGESYRVGQIGGFFRIPLGYRQLYAVCDQVGADAAPQTHGAEQSDSDDQRAMSGFRWLTAVLFGESVGHVFERGVSEYPTIGDEVHFVTLRDLEVIYGARTTSATVVVGHIAASSGIVAGLNVDGLLSRHCAIFGSTGSGKSNLVSVITQAISGGQFPAARILLVDPHGEYSTVGNRNIKTFACKASDQSNLLRVPFWALPFDELKAIALGDMQQAHEATIRDMILERKREAAKYLAKPPAPEALTADSPVPFSLKKLWFDLDDFERQTFKTVSKIKTLTNIVDPGDPEKLKSNKYEPYQPGSIEPSMNQERRHIHRQLDLLRSQLRDEQYRFLFDPGDGYSPDLNGRITKDLDSLVASWVGHERTITVLDVSTVPSEIVSTVVGLLVRVVYDSLFWAGEDSPISGRNQPLLIVLDEAHRFIPEKGESAAHRTLSRIAKEGRKYGVGLLVVTQRPSEIDGTVVSQCGTVISLRMTNRSDRDRVAAAFPDDLGGLTSLLPSLRTGEGLFIGDAMLVPSRVRIRHLQRQGNGDDPKASERWRKPRPGDPKSYSEAVENWRETRRQPKKKEQT